MKQLNKSELTAEYSIQLLPIGILTKRDDDLIQIINNEIVKMFNLDESTEELIGTNFNELILRIGLRFKNTQSVYIFFYECVNKKMENCSEFELEDNILIRLVYKPVFLENNLNCHIWTLYPVNILLKNEYDDEELKKQKLNGHMFKNLYNEIKNQINAIDSSISLLSMINSKYQVKKSTEEYFIKLNDDVYILKNKIEGLKKIMS
jgi:hypothetical protein